MVKAPKRSPRIYHLFRKLRDFLLRGGGSFFDYLPLVPIDYKLTTESIIERSHVAFVTLLSKDYLRASVMEERFSVDF
jgi:hypothetical protein